MIKKLSNMEMQEIKEALRGNIGRGTASFVREVPYKLPTDKKERQKLSDFFDEWARDHDDSGRMIPKRYE
jgi:hypothetical protein